MAPSLRDPSGLADRIDSEKLQRLRHDVADFRTAEAAIKQAFRPRDERVRAPAPTREEAHEAALDRETIRLRDAARAAHDAGDATEADRLFRAAWLLRDRDEMPPRAIDYQPVAS